MPARPKVDSLPDDLRAALDQRLVTGKFSGYRALEDWLNAELEKRGLELTLTHAAIHRYGLQFSERLNRLSQATQMAKAVAETVGDDKGALNEALLRLGQEHLFQLLLDLEQGGEETQKLIPKLSRSIADMSRAAVQQGKYREELKAKLADTLAEAEKPGADPTAALRKIREEIYGL